MVIHTEREAAMRADDADRTAARLAEAFACAGRPSVTAGPLSFGGVHTQRGRIPQDAPP